MLARLRMAHWPPVGRRGTPAFVLALAHEVKQKTHVHPLESYLTALLAIRSSGEGTDETSYYTPLNNLLDKVGSDLKPNVRCILTLRNRGAGHPDGAYSQPISFRRLLTTSRFLARSLRAEPWRSSRPVMMPG